MKIIFLWKKIWIDSFNKVSCSDLEKTIIDCLFKPDYAGGIVEVARAIYSTKDKLDYEKLLEYTIKFDSQAVLKRLGYILELFEIETEIIQELQKIKTASYIVLDTELPKTGKRNSRWSIQQNLDTETIKISHVHMIKPGEIQKKANQVGVRDPNKSRKITFYPGYFGV